MALGKEVANRPLTKRIFNPIQIIDYTHLLVIYDRVILAIAENRPRLRLPLAPTYDGKKRGNRLLIQAFNKYLVTFMDSNCLRVQMDKNRYLFWKLVEPEHLKARGFCRKLMGNREDGDDLYQDSLVCALSGFERLRKQKAFKPWLYRIFINGFKNRVKQPWWKRFAPLTTRIEEEIGGFNPVAQQAARRRLDIAFCALTTDEKSLVTLFELEGWACAELAELTGLTEGNVRVRLTRARGKMRKALIRYFRDSGSEKLIRTLSGEDKVCVVQKPAKD